MMGSESQILMHADVEEYDSGCALLLWGVLAFFCGCLMIAALFSGYELGTLIGKTARFFAPAALIGGVFHAVIYIMRRKTRMLVTSGMITLISSRCFMKARTYQIPFAAVRDIHALPTSLEIVTDNRNYHIRQLPEAMTFADQLRVILRQSGTDIPMTALERYQERKEITDRWKRKQVDRTLTPPEPVRIPVTADDHGQPILPQCLTDEQADGVFRPSAHAAEQPSDSRDAHSQQLAAQMQRERSEADALLRGTGETDI